MYFKVPTSFKLKITVLKYTFQIGKYLQSFEYYVKLYYYGQQPNVARIEMKRNFKSILKYLIYILITALVTTVVFKLSKKLDKNASKNIYVQLEPVADKQINSNPFPIIDWHDWEFINKEKLRTGNTIIIILLNTIVFKIKITAL